MILYPSGYSRAHTVLQRKNDIKQTMRRRKTTKKASLARTKSQELLSQAVDATIAFAKSDAEQPPKKMMDAVNRYLSILNRGRKRRPINTLIPHREILVGQIVIHSIRQLDEQQLNKAEKALLDIASFYARTYRIGNDWMADMAVRKETSTTLIDKATASAFRKGNLSMRDLINQYHNSHTNPATPANKTPST